MIGDEDLDKTLDQCGLVDMSRLSVVVGWREGGEDEGNGSEGAKGAQGS